MRKTESHSDCLNVYIRTSHLRIGSKGRRVRLIERTGANSGAR